MITYEMVSVALKTAYDLRLIPPQVDSLMVRDYMRLVLEYALESQPSDGVIYSIACPSCHGAFQDKLDPRLFEFLTCPNCEKTIRARYFKADKVITTQILDGC